MTRACSQPSEIFVNAEDKVAVLKCFSCGFSQEIGPGATVLDLVDIEEHDHRPARWKNG